MNVNKSNVFDRIPWFLVYLIIECIILYFSIVIPHEILKSIVRDYKCKHHTSGPWEIDGMEWMWGRSLGFTTLIWFIISTFQGIFMNKHAKLFHKKRKARDLHAISSFICIFFMFIHFIILLNSEPWRSVYLMTNKKHLPYEIFHMKIYLGIVAGTVMIIVSILSVFARNPKIMKKIGYKRFKIIHRIMMIFIIVIIIHVVYINTELWFMGYGKIY
jgi:predicted ferric reductase